MKSEIKIAVFALFALLILSLSCIIMSETDSAEAVDSVSGSTETILRADPFEDYELRYSAETSDASTTYACTVVEKKGSTEVTTYKVSTDGTKISLSDITSNEICVIIIPEMGGSLDATELNTLKSTIDGFDCHNVSLPSGFTGKSTSFFFNGWSTKWIKLNYAFTDVTSNNKQFFSNCNNLEYVEFCEKSSIDLTDNTGKKLVFFNKNEDKLYLKWNSDNCLKGKTFSSKGCTIELKNGSIFPNSKDSLIVSKNSIDENTFKANDYGSINFALFKKICVVYSTDNYSVLSTCNNVTYYADDTFTNMYEGAVVGNYTGAGTEQYQGMKCFLTFIGNSETITVPDDAVAIAPNALFRNTHVTKVILPNTIKIIGADAFGSSLKEIELYLSTIETIDSNAFSGVNKELKITDKSSSTTSKYTLYANYLLESDGDEVKTIWHGKITETKLDFSEYKFSKCLPVGENDSLEEVILPSTVISIPDMAFKQCSKLSKVTIKTQSGLSVGNYAFGSCTSLREIDLTSAVSIGESAFIGCSSLEKVVITSSLESIGAKAFENCSKLYRIADSDGKFGPKTIGEAAFNGAETLGTTKDGYTFDLSSGVETIGARAFAGTQLKTVTIPSTVTEIGLKYDGGYVNQKYAPSIFSGCKNLTQINVENGNTYFSSSDGLLLDADGSTLLICPEGKTEVVLPSTVTSLKTVNNKEECVRSVFVSSNLKKVDMSKTSISVLNDYEFYNCVGLKEVILSPETTVISKYAFSECSSLETVSCENSKLVSIGEYAFSKSSNGGSSANISEITLPATLETIGTGAFQECQNLRTVTFAEGSKLKTICSKAFTGCSSLQKLVLPSTVESIWYYDTEQTDEKLGYDKRIAAGMEGLFKGCSSLSQIIIESGNTRYVSSEDGKVVYGIGYNGTDRVSGTVYGGTWGVIWVSPFATEVTVDSKSMFFQKELDECSSLVSFTVDPNNAKYSSSGGLLLSKNGEILYKVPTAMHDVTIPSTVKQIGDGVNSPFVSSAQIGSIVWSGDSLTVACDAFKQCKTVSRISLTSTGDITFVSPSGSYDASFVSLGINCGGKLTVGENSLNSSYSHSVSVVCNELSMAGTFSKNIDFLSVKTKDSRVWSSLFSENAYGNINLELEGSDGKKYTDLTEVLTGYSVKLSDTASDYDLSVVSVSKSEVKFTIESSEGYRWNDLVVKSGEKELTSENGVYTCQMTDDAVITVTVKEGTEKVTLTLVFGNSIDDKTADIAKGMTLRKAQLTEFSKDVTLKGYELYGWYLDEKYSESYVPLSVTENLTLYAKWTLTDGYTVTWTSASDSLTATLDGKYLFNGEKVKSGSTVVFTYTSHSDIELLSWSIDGKTKCEEDGSIYKEYSLEVPVTDNTSVGTEERYVSLSNILNSITTSTVDVENMVLSWKYKCNIDASMSTWTGFPSEPLILGNYVYFRTGDHLVKLNIGDGTLVKDVEIKNTTAKSFYLYLGYGNGSILDFQTGKAYDLDLKEKWTVPEGIISAFYNGGYFYGLTAEGKLYKFNENGLAENNAWKEGIDTKWFGLYGATSAPVFADKYVYFIEASGTDRAVSAVNYTTGEKITTNLNSYIAGKYLDNGWLTSYEKDGVTYLFLTSYSTGLFDESSSSSTANNKDAILVFKAETDGSLTLQNRVNIQNSLGAGSAFIAYGSRGYVHFGGTLTGEDGGTLFVFDLSKLLTPYMPEEGKLATIAVEKDKTGIIVSSDNALIYCENSVYTHGSIVLNIGNDGHRTVMLVPYVSGESAVYFFDDYDGKTESAGCTKLADRSDQFSSQAVRVGPNGEMIWYTDSGVLKCYASANNVPVSVFIQGKTWTGWVSEQRNVSETDSKLIQILNKYGYINATASEQEGKIVAVIDGKEYVARIYVKNTDNTWFEVDTIDKIPVLCNEIMISFDRLDINKIEDDDYLYDAEGKNPVRLIDVIYDSSEKKHYYEFHDISFNLDGGEGDIASVGLTERGKTYTISVKNPTKEGYTFKGWMYNGKDVTSVTVNTSDIVLTAKWYLNVVYNLDGGSGATDGSYPIGEKITLPGKSGDAVTVTKTGYVFKGWFDGNNLYQAGDDYVVSAPVEFKAYWVAEGASEGTILEVTDSSGTIVNGQNITLRVDRTLTLSSLIKPTTAAQDVTWSSDAPGIVSVDRGVLTAVAPGTATITVKVINGYKDLSTTITVTVPAYSLVLDETVTEPMTVGDSAQLNAAYEGSRAVEDLVWNSSDPSVITVTDGKITAVGVGKAVITVTAPNGSKAECSITVAEQEITVVCSGINVGASAEPTVKADGVSVNDGYKFVSGNPTVVSVDGKKLVGQSVGVAEITVTYNGSVSKFVVRVNAVLVNAVGIGSTSAEMTVGDVKSLTYTLNPANPTDSTVTWSSSNPAVATVDQNGNITAVSDGKAVITVKSNDAGGKYASCTITVVKAKPVAETVSLNRTNLALVKDDSTNGQYTLTLKVTPADADVTVTWSSADSSVAAVDNSGKVTAKGAGTAVITVTVTSGNAVLSAICDVTVTEKPTVVATDEKSNDDGTKTTEVKESIKTGKDTTGEKTTVTVKDSDGNTKSVKTEYVFSTDSVKTTVTVTEDSDGNTETKATTTVAAKPTVSNGKKTVTVDLDALSTALTQIDSAKAATGIEDLDRIVTINVDDGKSVDEVTMNLTADQTGRISRSGGTSLLIESELGKIEVGNDVFASNSSEGDMKLSLKKVSEIVSVPKELESMNNVTFFEANLSVGGSSVHELGGSVKMSLPFALSEGQDSKKVHVCYIDNEGNVEYINCTFDSETGLAVFETTHFSTFAVVYGDVQKDTAPVTQTVSNGMDTATAAVMAVLAALVGAFGATTLMFVLRAKGKF